MIIRSTRKSVAAAVAFTVLSGISGLGNANLQEVDIQSVRVSFADLNLAQEEGQQTLYYRLRGAANEVCGEVQSKAASEVRQKRECYQNALNRAIREVGNEDVSSLHQG